MAKYTTSLHYQFFGEGEASGTDLPLVVTHDTYEDAVAFQTYILNPAFQVILENMRQAGIAVTPQAAALLESASNQGQAKKA